MAGLALMLGTAVPVTPSAAVGNEIRPGGYVWTSAGSCTLGFVFDGAGARAGKVYVGTAAGCVTGVGDDARLDSGVVFGDAAYIGDVSVAAWDFALIEVRSGFASAVRMDPAWPVGVASAAETRTGDRVHIVGHGVGMALGREGVLLEDESGGQHTFGPIGPGDAGAPLVHAATGKALGMVSRPGYCPGPRGEPCPVPLMAGPAPCPPDVCLPGWDGPTVQGMLARAAAAGFTVTLRTA